jgi:hypothetical protein
MTASTRARRANPSPKASSRLKVRPPRAGAGAGAAGPGRPRAGTGRPGRPRWWPRRPAAAVVDRHLVADGQAQPAPGAPSRQARAVMAATRSASSRAAAAGTTDQGDHQDRAHGLDGGHHDQGDEQVEDQVEGAGAVAHGGRWPPGRRPAAPAPCAAGPGRRRHRRRRPGSGAGRRGHGQHPAEQEHGQVGGEARVREISTTPREKNEVSRMARAASSPTRRWPPSPGQQHRRQHPEGQGPEQQGAAEQVGDHHPGEHGVGQGVADEGQAPQHHQHPHRPRPAPPAPAPRPGRAACRGW